MDPKTKKGLFIGCGIAGVLLIACCILSIVLAPLMGKKFVEKGVPMILKSALAKDLPEGVDRTRVDRLIDHGWAQLLQQGFGQDLDQQELQRLMNVEFPDAMKDETVTPEEFDHLVDRFNAVLFNSAKDPDSLEALKNAYRAGKEDGELSVEEINRVLEEMERVLNS
jgi:hypothetical protein